MGCYICRRKGKETDNGDGGDDSVNKENGENKEETLYATIDHGNSKGTGKHMEMDDSCDYAMVNIPSTPVHQLCEDQNFTNEYVFMN